MEYGSNVSCKNEYRDESSRERGLPASEPGYTTHQQYALMQQKIYACTKDLNEPNVATYCRVASGVYESSSSQQYQNSRYNNSTVPTFSSPPNSPLVGLVFDPSSPNYSGSGMMNERSLNSERRSQSSWSVSNQEPIGTGAKKKIVKSHEKRNTYAIDPRYQAERYKDCRTEVERSRKDKNLTSESTSSLDFFAEGERMVSELCNIEANTRSDNSGSQKSNAATEDDKNKTASSEMLLTALDKIVIHDQIPSQIVQLAVEACTDAENIAIAHHNRPCFKNIHSICAKTRSNVQKPDSAVANLHSQGIPWVIKNFIFSFVRILDGWKGVKELLSEKHDTFSRIENKYYSPNIRECFVQWQAVTKEMLTHIYKTFKCLDTGFTLEQKSFTHNYYATNAARQQNQSKFQGPKSHVSTPRPVNVSPQAFSAIQPPWVQTPSQSTSGSYDNPWPLRPGVPCKKYPVVPPPNSHNFYPLNEPSDVDNYQKLHYKCDPCSIREAKPRQSWTITNVPDFRSLDGVCHADQRELYNQLKHKMDAELGKAPGQPIMSTMTSELLQRREMELKAKIIPLSHVEKTLIPNMGATDMRGCYVQKNNSCGDTKEETDFFAAWGQMVQKEPNEFITHHAHGIPIPSNVVTLTNNISGPVQFIDTDNDEFHEMSKVYMKPGSYKVPIKADPLPFMSTPQDVVYENQVTEDIGSLKMKVPYPPLVPPPKSPLETWPGIISRRIDDMFGEEQRQMPNHILNCINMRSTDPLDILSSMTSDRAWEAAKLSAPKLMDFLHEGSKSDTARLYDALGLNTIEAYSNEAKQLRMQMENEGWTPDASNLIPAMKYPKEIPNLWDQQSSSKREFLFPQSPEPPGFEESLRTPADSEHKSSELDEIPDHCDLTNIEDVKESGSGNKNFDQTGSHVKDDNHKKPSAKNKTAASGMWYHPKKKKPLSSTIVKKFETILSSLSQINEANFIQHDMDIKMAPRFYEVVKYPMSLNDICTKLKNSNYTDYEHVVQDFRRIFNNVRQYLKSYPDATMKKNVNKVSADFEKLLIEEFQNKENKNKDNSDHKDNLDKKEARQDNHVSKLNEEHVKGPATKQNDGDPL